MLFTAFVLGYVALSLWLGWTDYRTGYLPDRFTCPLLWLGLSYHLCFNPGFLTYSVAGALTGYFFFYIVYQLFKWCRGYEGLGYGDIKLLAALGAWHGWQQLSFIIFLAAAGGCLIAILIAWVKHNAVNIKKPLPFGPFLAAAGLVSGWQTFRLPEKAIVALLL